MNQVFHGALKASSALFASRRFGVLGRQFIDFLHAADGQGSGSGWDVKGEVRAALKNLQKVDPVLLDVGANTGLWTRLALRSKPASKIWMFEPNPGCFVELRAIAENATLVPAALSDRTGEATLHLHGATDLCASMDFRRDSFLGDARAIEIEVNCLRLDDWITQSHVPVPDLVKIDAEGHEYQILKGFGQLLEQRLVELIAFEFGSANLNSGIFFRDFWDLLTGCGYSLSRILAGGRLVSVSRYDERLEYFRGASNYLARAKPASASGL